jgi:hypothetical protein
MIYTLYTVLRANKHVLIIKSLYIDIHHSFDSLILIIHHSRNKNGLFS